MSGQRVTMYCALAAELSRSTTVMLVSVKNTTNNFSAMNVSLKTSDIIIKEQKSRMSLSEE
jgi:hypothetical protein